MERESSVFIENLMYLFLFATAKSFFFVKFYFILKYIFAWKLLEGDQHHLKMLVFFSFLQMQNK